MIVTSTDQLKVGDVVQISVQLRDRNTGNDFWWKRFACVLRVSKSPRRAHFEALTLKMHIDKEKDIRIIDLDDTNQVVERLPEEKWPQGVLAMRMKWVTKGLINLDS